jgi:geranylgeranyl diphosphate synthase, type II
MQEKLDFKTAIAAKATAVNDTLNSLIEAQGSLQPRLREAICYCLGPGGKRIRAAVLLWCSEAVVGKPNQAAQIAAAAVEMVHTYSLIHDDLPAMDDDDMRRGQLSCHKAFDEATAILTGDAMLTLAFEVLASDIDDLKIAARLIRTLACAAGPAGMVAGQMADLQNAGSEAAIETLMYIHTNKTARMFEAAAAMGAIAAGLTEQQIDRLGSYGLKIGLAFQIADDILDLSATSHDLGKTAGKDSKQGKITYPAMVGIDKSRAIAAELTDGAIAQLSEFGCQVDILRQLAKELLERTR